MRQGWTRVLGVCFALTAGGAVAEAQPSAEERLTALESRYQALRQQTELELERLEQEIRALRHPDVGAISRSRALQPVDASTPTSGGDATPRPAATPPQASLPITLSGDFRLRYEHTTSGPAAEPSRDRGALRGRLGAEYQASEHLELGARITTGDPDDPNSTDVTLGNFTDDLDVSLDRAYVAFAAPRSSLLAGKFANPLLGTDLVWDGDVSPQGVAASHRVYDSAALQADVTAIYALVDEQEAGSDSEMTGAQLDIRLPGRGPWSGRLAVGYYDYAIGSLANADAGDVRGNLLNGTGDDYLSDFDLLDVIAEVKLAAPGSSWPLTLTANYVHNFGAEVAEDSGYAGTLAAGRADGPGDVRVSYGYTLAETDAVFAAFSHDNTTYPTNYRQHSVGIDYVPLPGMLLNLTGYRYHRDEPIPGTEDDPITRIRLNWSLQF